MNNTKIFDFLDDCKNEYCGFYIDSKPKFSPIETIEKLIVKIENELANHRENDKYYKHLNVAGHYLECKKRYLSKVTDVENKYFSNTFNGYYPEEISDIESVKEKIDAIIGKIDGF